MFGEKEKDCVLVV